MMQKNKLYIAIAFVKFGIFLPIIAQAACPGNASTPSFTVNYNRLSATATTVNVVSTSPTISTNTNAQYRDMMIIKENKGIEAEGVKWDVLQGSGGNLAGFSSFSISPGNYDFSNWWRPSSSKITKYRSGSPSQNSTGTASFIFSIDPNQNLTPGQKTIEFVNTVNWGASYGCPYFSGNISATSSTYILNVLGSASLNLSGGAVSGLINFDTDGGIIAGAKKSVDLNINSGSGYRISLDSLNNGVLKNQTTGLESQTVAYTSALITGGIATNIAEGTPYNSSSATSGTETKKLEITIGNTDSVRAGKYKDTLVITISPL